MPNTKVKSQKLKVKNEAAELLTKQQLRVEISKVRLAIRAGKEKNTRKVFNLRKKLARILTLERKST